MCLKVEVMFRNVQNKVTLSLIRLIVMLGLWKTITPVSTYWWWRQGFWNFMLLQN